MHTIKYIAKRYGISDHRVLAWIHSGQLPATNVATRLGIRPSWRISTDDLERFERSRMTYPAPKRQTRRRKVAATAGDRY